MASETPPLFEYARFYNIAEDSSRYCPLNYVDDTCEPTPPVPPISCLNPEHPEEHLKEVEQRFCTGFMLDKIPTKSRDMDYLGDCLKIDSGNKNLWRGILPDVRTSDLNTQPVLLTMEDEKMLSAPELQTTFDEDPFASPLDYPESFAHGVSPSPGLPVRVVVPSGPDIPFVPGLMRDVFDHFNSDITLDEDLVGGATVSVNHTMQSQNLTHHPADAMPVPHSELFQIASIESDPFASTHDGESEDSAQTTLSSEQPTENEPTEFPLDDGVSAPTFFDVSPCHKSQPAVTIVSSDLTKEKALFVSRCDPPKAQTLGDLKEVKGTKPSLKPVSKRVIGYGKEGILASTTTTQEDTPDTPKDNSSGTLRTSDQCTPRLALFSHNSNNDNQTLDAPDNHTRNNNAAYKSCSMDKQGLWATQEERSRTRLECKSTSLNTRNDLFKSQQGITCVNSNETPARCKATFGGLGSLSMFMETRGNGCIYQDS